MTQVRILLLGPIRVDDAGEEVSFAAAKVRSLLAALALSPGALVTADSLIYAL